MTMASKGIKGITIEGFKEEYKRQGLLEEEILKAAIKGLKITAQNIAGEAIKICPKETGTLSRSIVVTMGGTPDNSEEIYQNAKNNSEVINKAKEENKEVDPSELKRIVGKAKNGYPTIVSVSANTPYARRQHEDPTFKHKEGEQAKYLEQPFNQKAPYLEVNVGDEIHKVLKRKSPS